MGKEHCIPLVLKACLEPRHSTRNGTCCSKNMKILKRIVDLVKQFRVAFGMLAFVEFFSFTHFSESSLQRRTMLWNHSRMLGERGRPSLPYRLEMQTAWSWRRLTKSSDESLDLVSPVQSLDSSESEPLPRVCQRPVKEREQETVPLQPASCLETGTLWTRC